MSEYDYWIITDRLGPSLLGGHRYRAFVGYMYHNDGTLRTRVDRDFGETCGRTDEEARQKMEEKIRSWQVALG